MPRESNLQSKCIAYLKSLDIYFINKYGDGRTGKGTPDLIVCIKGKFVTFELKVEGNKPSPSQIIIMKKIKKCGGLTYVPYTFDAFKKIVDKLRS